MRRHNIRILVYLILALPAAVLAGICLRNGSPVAAAASAHAQEALWQDVTPGSAETLGSVQVSELASRPHKAFQLNEAALEKILADAPLEFTEAAKDSPKEITLPTPDGGFARFRFVEAPIMEPELAAKFPEIKTYRGWGIDDPTATTRFSRTSGGFHAIALSARGAFCVDPLSRDDNRTYASYYLDDDAGGDSGAGCLLGSGDHTTAQSDGGAISKSARPDNLLAVQSASNSTGTVLRTFRLAVAATGEYTTNHGGTVASALQAINDTINSVNLIYERELAVRFILVNNNTSIIFTDPATDQYTSGNVNLLVDENQARLDQLIKASNYDIGHVLDTNSGTEGRGEIGVVCVNGEKGKGTSNTNWDTDLLTVALRVAHEIGHQLGAEHTFNNPGCSQNLNVDTAYEPGCGRTIMSYSRTGRIPYFHGTSLRLMADYLDNCGCGFTSSNNNTPPAISVPTPAQFDPFGAFAYIPAQTPFSLTASGSDANNDILTYSWEETDNGSPGPAGADRGDNPLFRVETSDSPSMMFPELPKVLNPAYVNGESLPTTCRYLHFLATARDNHGGFDQGRVVVGVMGDRGPFVVTQPAFGTQALTGSSLTVTWDVAGTNTALINTSNVRILLSTDGGATFPIELAASTLNDGSFTFTVPCANTERARIKVEAIGNIFFNISPAFTIIGPTITTTGSLTITNGGPTVTAPVATVADGSNAAGSLNVSPRLPLPNGVSLRLINNNGTISAEASAVCSAIAAPRSITVDVTNSFGCTASSTFNLIVDLNPPPILGNYNNATVVAGQTVVVSPSAAPFDPNGNLSNLTASILVPNPVPGRATLAVDQTSGVVRIITTGALAIGVHQIRVEATDSCDYHGTKDFFLTVTNSPPQINTSTGNPVRTTQGGVSSAPVTVATVSDQQDAAGALKVSVSYPQGFPPGVIVQPPTNSNGVIKATATATCTVAPASYNATVTVRDSSGATASASISIIVDSHLPPVLGTYLDSSVTVGGTLVIVPNVPPSDPNNPNGPVTLTVNPGPLPGGGSVTIPNQTNGRLTAATVITTQLGTYQVIVTATDACGAQVSRSFKLKVRSASCTTEQGVVLVADTGNHRVQRFGGAWNVIGAGTQGTGLGQFTSPEGAVSSSDGRKFYIADTGNRRIQWSTNGGGTWTIFASNLVPQGLVLDRDGNLYVSDAQDNLVLRYTGGNPGTPIVLAGSGSTAGRVRNPNGLAIDCRMNLYIADTGNNRILVIGNADSVGFPNLGTILAGSGALLNPAQVTAPQGVAVDDAGKLYIADTGNDRVLMIAGAPAQNPATVLCAFGAALGQVRGPEGVTIAAFTGGPLGGVESIIVCDTTNNRIQGRNLSAGSWMLIPPPAGGGPGAAIGQFNLPSKIR